MGYSCESLDFILYSWSGHFALLLVTGTLYHKITQIQKIVISSLVTILWNAVTSLGENKVI